MDSEKRKRRLAKLHRGEEDLDEVEVAAPKKRAETVVVSLRLPTEVADTLAMKAEEDGKPTGTLARELIENALAQTPEASLELMSIVLSRLVARFEGTRHLPPFVGRPFADVLVGGSVQNILIAQAKEGPGLHAGDPGTESRTTYRFPERVSESPTHVTFGGNR